jgi:hypothetical protein
MKIVYSILAIAFLAILPGMFGKVDTLNASPVPDDLQKPFRVLVKFKDGLLSHARFEHAVSEISSWEIRNVFATYEVSVFHEVFKNRYDKKGRIKANPIGPYSLQGWQELPFNSRNFAEQFIREIKHVTGIENALIETALPIRAAIAPNDPLPGRTLAWSRLDKTLIRLTEAAE